MRDLIIPTNTVTGKLALTRSRASDPFKLLATNNDHLIHAAHQYINQFKECKVGSFLKYI